MKLYDEEELRKKNEKSKRMKNMILVSIIFTIVLIVLLMGGIYYLVYNPNKITIMYNGKENEKIENMIKTKSDDNGDTTIYFPIRQIASIFGYNSGNGDFGRNVEGLDNCYVESENEVTIFTNNSNIIYRIDKTVQENNTETKYKYEEIKLKRVILKDKDVLYVDLEGLQETFNLYISTNSKMKKINITSLDTLIKNAQSKVTEKKLGKLDEKFVNYKAILNNMMVIESNEYDGKKGVRSLSSGEEILGFQYDEITYVPSKDSFLVKKDNKVGIIGSDGIVKIRPQYDNLILIDSENGLYLAEDNTYFGVIDENQNLKIYFEYKKIGVDISQFEENDIRNEYVLLGKLIPAQKMDGKWIFYKINSTTNSDGEKVIECKELIEGFAGFENIGCVVSNVNNRGIINNLMIIKEYNLVVVYNNKHYGFMDLNGKPVLGVVYTNAFLETTSGVTDYCAIDDNGNTIKIIDELKNRGYEKVE